MGTTNISSIGKFLVQNQNLDVNGSAGEEDLKVAFAEVISQMTSSLADSGLTTAYQKQDNAESLVTTGSNLSADEPERYRYREPDIRESTGRDYTDSQVTEKTDTFADEVKEVLKDELGVSEEQLETAMETLGLTFVDLLDPKQLAELVTELTGAEDVSELLLSGEFMTVMEAVGTLGGELSDELGVSAEELMQLLETMPEQTADAAPQMELLDVADAAGEAPEEAVPVMEDEAGMPEAAETPVQSETAQEPKPDRALETAGNAEEAKTVAKQETKALDETDTESRTEEAETEDIDEMDTKTADTADKQESAASGGQTSGNQSANAGTDQTVVVNQTITEVVYEQGAEGMTEVSYQVDVSDIIRQITEYARVTIDNTATTLEMQLNPENLGKLYLEVTSREGMVSARIMAQNEIVKEALESQIAELRQSLNEAGVKVEAVEVTVGSHEFERNLEQNAKQEERQAEEQEKAAKQTRRINLNDLDDLSGLMTEEESLVARMMADQGNSIDFTA